MNSKHIFTDLSDYASAQRKKICMTFFKTGKGEYGEGDQFLGVTVPDCRRVAKTYRAISRSELKRTLSSPFHEMRLTALFILTYQYERGDEEQKKEIAHFYLHQTKYINNWDLVDASAHKILGDYLWHHPREQNIFQRLVSSHNLWERRISMIATIPFIKQNEFMYTMRHAEALLWDTHDLTHKAVGWMLREVWKRDHLIVENFIQKQYQRMPRTMLRYAIEKIEPHKRKNILKGRFT